LVEVLEYALVVAVSSVLTVFSIVVFGGLSSTVGPATDEADFAAVVALANAAIQHGSSTSNLVFDNASIGCDHGTITFHTARFSQNSSIPVDCSFQPEHVNGARQLTFDYSGGLLTVEVR
jgi:hypothetical protein